MLDRLQVANQPTTHLGVFHSRENQQLPTFGVSHCATSPMASLLVSSSSAASLLKLVPGLHPTPVLTATQQYMDALFALPPDLANGTGLR